MLKTPLIARTLHQLLASDLEKKQHIELAPKHNIRYYTMIGIGTFFLPVLVNF